MRGTEPSWTDVVTAIAAAVTAALTVTLALAAVWAAMAAKHTLDAARAANEQAERDSIARTRPYVFAEIVGSLAGSPNWDLRITNVGNSTARNLTLDYDSWPAQPDDICVKVKELFETPRDLPPRGSIRVYWRLQAKKGSFSDGTTEAGLPRTGIVSARYTSDDPSNPSYEDSFTIMIDKSGYMPRARGRSRTRTPNRHRAQVLPPRPGNRTPPGRAQTLSQADQPAGMRPRAARRGPGTSMTRHRVAKG